MFNFIKNLILFNKIKSKIKYLTKTQIKELLKSGQTFVFINIKGEFVDVSADDIAFSNRYVLEDNKIKIMRGERRLVATDCFDSYYAWFYLDELIMTIEV